MPVLAVMALMSVVAVMAAMAILNREYHNGCDGYNCYITFLDIFGLSERPGNLT